MKKYVNVLGKIAVFGVALVSNLSFGYTLPSGTCDAVQAHLDELDKHIVSAQEHERQALDLYAKLSETKALAAEESKIFYEQTDAFLKALDPAIEDIDKITDAFPDPSTIDQKRDTEAYVDMQLTRMKISANRGPMAGFVYKALNSMLRALDCSDEEAADPDKFGPKKAECVAVAIRPIYELEQYKTLKIWTQEGLPKLKDYVTEKACGKAYKRK